MKEIKPTQNQIVFEYLKLHRRITVAESARLLNIYHLPRRIKDLEEKGIYIKREDKKVITKSGRPTVITVYHFNPGDEQLVFSFL